MSLTPEWLTAYTSLATLLVVALTAFAALRQIRHLRSGNQVAAVLPLLDQWESLRDSMRYIRTDLAHDLEDPEIRMRLSALPRSGPATQALAGVNFYESVGALVVPGTLDLELVLRYFDLPSDVWEKASRCIAIVRRSGGKEVLEHFEALVQLERKFIAKRGSSLYPRHLTRMPLEDIDAEADAAYARERQLNLGDDGLEPPTFSV
ncbi:MAG: hypothetical protein NVSMB64_29850 [Candidatus Velthaea sp.]